MRHRWPSGQAVVACRYQYGRLLSWMEEICLTGILALLKHLSGSQTWAILRIRDRYWATSQFPPGCNTIVEPVSYTKPVAFKTLFKTFPTRSSTITIDSTLRTIIASWWFRFCMAFISRGLTFYTPGLLRWPRGHSNGPWWLEIDLKEADSVKYIAIHVMISSPTLRILATKMNYIKELWRFPDISLGAWQLAAIPHSGNKKSTVIRIS